jgi:hypothetical protein
VPFFEPLDEPPPEFQQEGERSWAPPAWDRPSEGTLPAVVGVSRLLSRTDNVAVAVDHVRVSPNGFQIVVGVLSNPRLAPELRTGGFASFSLIAARRPAPDEDDATPRVPSPPLRPYPGWHMGPRMGVRFSNGQSAQALGLSPFDVPKDEEGIPTEPVIRGGGGGGGNGIFRFEYWIFPLPPPGPLEVFAEWPTAGIEETSIVLDGDEIRAAAHRAIVLWS